MRPRVTQTAQVCFDPGDGAGRLFALPFMSSDRAVGMGDPYVRTITVGEEWQVLELGHLKACSLMVLVNEATRWDRNPTDAQRLEAASRIIELSHGSPITAPLDDGGPKAAAGLRTMFSAPLSSSGKGPPAGAYRVDRLIYPGEHDKGVPADLSSIRLRCRRGTARCTLYLFPE